MYALFRGEIQIARTFPTVQEVIKTALEEGLIPESPRITTSSASKRRTIRNPIGSFRRRFPDRPCDVL
jgi:hypothetical protein